MAGNAVSLASLATGVTTAGTRDAGVGRGCDDVGMTTTTVRDNSGASRFEITVDGELAGFVDYREHDGEYALPHTRVLPAYEGRGIGSELVVGTLKEIRRRGGTVLPYCPFVPKVIRDNPEFVELVPTDQRTTFEVA